jgi:glycosyltransferase involved in cell wall biosynthesis/peptidoglycan/xylan/chitin deacetylase (PgdA/CDA1 family)
MRISVVITTHNRRQLLAHCLESLAAQNFAAEDFEIIVIADGCADGTGDFLRGFKAPCTVQVIEHSNQGQAYSQNVGVAAACGDLILFMDDDCECTPELLAAHAQAHCGQEKLVVIGAVQLHPKSPPGIILQAKTRFSENRYQRLLAEVAGPADMMLCANSSIAREAALKNPFDPSYLRIHDIEAGVRLWEDGYRPRFARSAVVYEHFNKNAADIVRDSYYQGIFEVKLIRAHPAFKPLAEIVCMNQGNVIKRAVRKHLARHRAASDVFLRLVNSLAIVPGMLKLAQTAMSARFVVALLSGAIREAGSWTALENIFGKRVPVVMFHNVGAPRAGEYPGLTTPIPEFKAQIDLISRMGYKTILPSDWSEWRARGGSLPVKPIMLVFDDAYAEAAENAFPLLERRGMCATCMVVTSCIGDKNRWDENSCRPSFQMMSSEAIREWSSRGIEFGCHSVTHPDMSKLTEDDALREVIRCKEDLTSLLGKTPIAFAYPFGRIGSGAYKAVREHFELGFTSWQGRLHLGTDPSLVPRIFFVPGETRFGMWCRLRLERNPMQVILVRWRRLLRYFGAAGCDEMVIE